jgi:N-acetylneuraminic acid mutarotase
LRTSGRRRLAVVLGATFAALAMSPPGAVLAAPEPTPSAGATAQPLCEAPAEDRFSCFALKLVPGAETAEDEASTPDGYGPADLRDAYRLPADGGEGQTIAVVAAFDAPAAEADLAVYRAKYDLPACTTANGCFRKVDQRGGTAYPVPDEGWAGEIALDLDMVSAVAPRANLLLVEADSNYSDDLGAAVDMAVALGAKYVNNSYGSIGEYADETVYDVHYNHPGVAIVAASGDVGYGASFPAASSHVTSVGGTSLVRDSSGRRWSETVWNSSWVSRDGQTYWGATGSGCSRYFEKPAFQTDEGCAGRTIADVSAVADPVTGVAVYNSYSDDGWAVYGGTSAASPIVTGIYAVAGTPVDGSQANSYPYANAGALYDVVQGDNASCEPGLCNFGTTPQCDPGYLCKAQAGYDGPTGLGTPNGTAAFRSGPHGTVSGTVTDKATGAPILGAKVSFGQWNATTDAGGGYRLVIPEGSYTGSVTAFGYRQAAIGETKVADGAALTVDVPLESLPSQVVSGTVTDGGGHGWPLYARIEIGGGSGAPVFTDPATGRYSVKLPENASYTFTVSAEYPGYLPKTQPVEVGTAPVNVDVALPVDAEKANAAGYSLTYHGGGMQAFDGRSTPDGWTVVNNTANGGWRFDDPLGRGNRTGGGGGFAIVDDFAQGWSSLDTELRSPSYNLSTEKAPVVEFDTHLPPEEQFNRPTATMDVSFDGGANWYTMWNSPPTLIGPTRVTVSLAPFAGQKDVRIRFHYVGSLANIWQLDRVAVGTRLFEPQDGGLVVGRVTDANTGEGVVGATVYAEGYSHGKRRDRSQVDGRATTVATPDDKALGDGLYWLFSPQTGKRKVTAEKAAFGYPAESETVKVGTGTTRADVALKPGRLEATPAAVDSTVAWGGTRNVTFTVRNTGAGTATFALGEQSGAAPAAVGSTTPLDRVKVPTDQVTAVGGGGKAAPGAARPQPGSTWRDIADLPLRSTGGVAGAYDGKLYAGLGNQQEGTLFSNAFSSYDPVTGAWTELESAWYRRWAPVGGFINGRFYVTSGRDSRGGTVAATEYYDPKTGKWTAVAANPTPYGSSGSAVLDGKLYVVGGCYMVGWGSEDCSNADVMVYDAASDTWSKAASYPSGISRLSCGGIAGKVYCAGGLNANGVTAAGYAYDPKANTWSPIADLPVDLMMSAYAVANGKLLVSTGYSGTLGAVTNEGYAYDPGTDTWSPLPNANAAVTGAAGAAGFYLAGGSDPATGLPLTSVELLPGYDQPYGDVAWLSARAQQYTLRPGQSARVTLTLDAGRRTTSPLTDYTAAVVLDADTPYPVVTVPVTMRIGPAS